ncbi:MAG: CPBP family intramembrane metalloprotease [Candidatus Schekmanbacteria bacterium]|nr:CPBP family intramembrane metalloprotease [Candidatus Schekmanbacteria bacterium]
MSRRRLLSVFVGQYLVFIALAAVWIACCASPAANNPVRVSAAAVLCGAAAGALLSASAWGLAELWPAFGDSVSWLQRELLSRLRPIDIPILALLSGIVEEVVFRWLLAAELGLLMANAIFAALHFMGRRHLAYTLWTFGAGMLFSGLLLASHGNLVVPIVAHVVNNAAAMVISLRLTAALPHLPNPDR